MTYKQALDKARSRSSLCKMCHAAIGGSAEGVELYFNKIKEELYDNMLITGCGTLFDITPNKIRNRNSY